MSRGGPKPRADKCAVKRMLLEGLSDVRIAEALGAPLSAVQWQVRSMYGRGELVPTRARLPDNADVLDALGLDPHTIAWVRRNTPTGATPADLIRAIIADAVEADVENLSGWGSNAPTRVTP